MSNLSFDFHNKTCLVTGSSSGIGFSIAEAFCRAGAKTVINGRSLRRLEEAKSLLPRSQYCLADVTSEDGVKALVECVNTKFSELDVLVCNVGCGRSVSPGEEDASEWHRMFRLNVLSSASVVHAMLPKLRASKGCIVLIGSICGHETIDNAPLAYAACKSALISYASGLARVVGDFGVRINTVSPGNILFEGSTWEKKIAESPGNVEKMLREQVPLKRFGTAEEVADVVLFLSSAEASFVTGSVITVDGGQTRS